MSDTPLIKNWRIIASHPGSAGILVGFVTGHPILADGWVTTSIVLELDRSSEQAQTVSRRYRLRDELPDHLPLPDGAWHALLMRLLRNMETLGYRLSIGELEEICDRLSVPPVKLQ